MRAWVVLIALALMTSNVLSQPAASKRDISGTVVDPDGKPVGNATLTIEGGASVTTAADGTFKLSVPPTNLTIDVAAEGFTERKVTIIGAKTALSLQVALVHPPPAAAPPTRTVGGVVLDANKAPLAGATVKVAGTALSTTTAADGTFSIPDVATTDVTLDIEATGQPATQIAVPAAKSTVVVTVGGATTGEPQAPPPPPNRVITGKVIDPVSSEPIAAAEVTVKSTGQVVFSEADGTFRIENVPPGPVVLAITGPERETRAIDVGADQTTVNVTLAIVQGEQILVEGRAPVIVKQNLANGASVVDDKALNRVSAPTLDSALQGKVSGANLQFNSGAPGGGAQLRLRGISTINGQSSPLFVVDGVIISNVATPPGTNAITAAAAGGSSSTQDNPVNRLADINPNDIETVEVLKGASAAALYGSKAANGVVIITTKRGRSGETRVSVTQRIGTAQVSNTLGSRHFSSAQDVMDAFGPTSPLVQAFNDAGGKTYDHEREITRTTFARETLASASGGTDKGNYYASTLIRDEPGVVIGTFYQKQTGRLAVGYKFGDRVHVGATANVMHTKSDRGLTNNDNTGTSNYVVLSGTPNFVNLQPQNGVYPANPAVGSGANPMQTVSLFQNREDVWRFIGGLNGTVDAYKSDEHKVRAIGNFGADSYEQKNNILSPNELTFEPTTDGLAGTSVDATTTNLNYNVGAGVVWNYEPKKDKTFRSALTGGFTYESVDLSSVYVIAQNLNAGQSNVDSGTSVNIAQRRLRTKDSGLYVQEELATLKDRLSVLGGLLGERSSLNGNTDKYFVYPKLATVYSLIDPSPAADSKFDVLRVRAAYGQAGNRPNYGQKFTPLNATGNIQGIPGLTIGTQAAAATLGDPNIEPERQHEFELGADAALKDQRVVAEITAYQRNISNLLLQRSLATSTGYTTEFFNGGSMRNAGVELALQATPVSTKTFDWTTRGILTLNRSRITSLPVPAFDITAAGFGTGLGAFRIEKDKSATQIVGTIDSMGTVAVVGNGEPDFRVGWSNIVNAGPFTFGALVDWQQGSDIVNLTRLLYDFGNNSPDADAAKKRLETFSNGDVRPYVEDATFVKLRELSAVYNVPKRIAKQIGSLDSLQIGLAGRNLLTLTNYSGLDPEVSNFGNQPIGRNYDVAPYPPSRSFWLSITAGL